MDSLNGSIQDYDPQTKAENAFCAAPFVRPEHIVDGTPVSASKLVGSDLTDAVYSALEARWIDRGLADHAQLRSAPELPILVMEGESKVLAFWRLANNGSPCRPRFLLWPGGAE